MEKDVATTVHPREQEKKKPNAAVSGRPKGESVLTAWFFARAERGRQAVAAYRRILPRA
jgi:hypothetical protein